MSSRPPRTLSELRRLLSERGLSPRRRLGQNFLVDPNALEAIVREARPTAGEAILEVGPGPGTLTARLLEAGARVLAVEIDVGLADLLEDLLGDHAGLTLVRGDVLRGKHAVNPEVLRALEEHRAGGGWRLVANLPYQAASPLVADLVGLACPPTEMLVTVQAEVADRMIARPGEPAYGLLAATLALAARTERVRDLPPHVFWPRPKVRSSVIRVRPDPGRRDTYGDWGTVEAFLRDAFHHRRKTLRQGLAASGWSRESVSDALARLGLEANVRAEALPPEVLVRLGTGR